MSIWLQKSASIQPRTSLLKFEDHRFCRSQFRSHAEPLVALYSTCIDEHHHAIYFEDEINQEFKSCDVALVIGANDVVNPIARTDPSSEIYGMPILDADYASNVIVVKRGQGTGFSGIENILFFLDNTRMLYGDGKAVATDLVNSIKEL